MPARRLPRFLKLTALVAVVAAGATLAVGALRPYDPAPWLEDLATLERASAGAFANLEWHVQSGTVDPVALHRRTDSLLRAAGSDGDARAALRAFAEAFQDGHFRVVRPTPALVRRVEDWWRGRRDGLVPRSGDAGAVCAALGYRLDLDAGLLASAPGYRDVRGADAVTAAGTVPLPAGGTAGVLRIASFGTERHGPLCERVWPRLHDSLPPADTCDETCADPVWWAVSNAILADHREAVAAVRAAGATVLLVDLTGNGGGTDWADPAARQLSARPLRSQPFGFLRHAHYTARFAEDVAAFDSALGRTDITDGERGILADARARAARAHALTLAPCDRSALWTGGAAAVGCRQLETGLAYVSGWLDHLPREEARRLPAGERLFRPAAFDYVEGAWDGPVVVVADRRTASASEQFMALLRDNDAARVVGERTLGAGCGFTNGGLPVTLPHSGLLVRMPDCARFRRTGENEVAGMAPDLPAGWQDGDDDRTRATKLLAALGTGGR